jgi:malate dehydrogenase
VLCCSVLCSVPKLYFKSHLPWTDLLVTNPASLLYGHVNYSVLTDSFLLTHQPLHATMTQSQTNASIVKTLVEGCAEFCPNAVLAIISNPVNSTVPIAAEILKKWGVYNPNKLMGVTTLDVVRANTFAAEYMGVHPSKVDVTVIGGHAGITILPLYSQVPGFKPSAEELEAMTVRTQFGGDEVVKAKAGAGSATLSMAYAGFVFTENIIKALNGESITQCAYVESSLTDATYFASPCKFGLNGVEEVLGYGDLTPYEKAWFDKMVPELQKQIQKGVDFANSP